MPQFNSIKLLPYLQVMLVAIHPWDCAGAKQVGCMDLTIFGCPVSVVLLVSVKYYSMQLDGLRSLLHDRTMCFPSWSMHGRSRSMC